jgi:hypothetical protein
MIKSASWLPKISKSVQRPPLISTGPGFARGAGSNAGTTQRDKLQMLGGSASAGCQAVLVSG